MRLDSTIKPGQRLVRPRVRHDETEHYIFLGWGMVSREDRSWKVEVTQEMIDGAAGLPGLRPTPGPQTFTWVNYAYPREPRSMAIIVRTDGPTSTEASWGGISCLGNGHGVNIQTDDVILRYRDRWAFRLRMAIRDTGLAPQVLVTPQAEYNGYGRTEVPDTLTLDDGSFRAGRLVSVNTKDSTAVVVFFDDGSLDTVPVDHVVQDMHGSQHELIVSRTVRKRIRGFANSTRSLAKSFCDEDETKLVGIDTGSITLPFSVLQRLLVSDPEVASLRAELIDYIAIATDERLFATTATSK